MEAFRIPAGPGTDEYTVSRSRFIGYAEPVSSAQEAEAFVGRIRAMHREARHTVFAYKLRSPAAVRFSDDGEPQGTAGKPVLEVIEKSGLTNCAVAVTRYFGGVLLGAGGLVRAYAHTAKLALTAAGAAVMRPCVTLRVTVSYAKFSSAEALIAQHEGEALGRDFGENVTLLFRLPLENRPAFETALSELTLGGVRAQLVEEGFAPLKTGGA